MSIIIEALDLLIAERLVHTDISRQRYHGQLQGPPRGMKRGPAQGTFSKTKEHHSDPHLVTKHNYHPMGEDQMYSDDGFAVFVRYLDSMDLMDNPHFPKVYKAKKIVDKSDSHINTFDTEKLVEANALTLAEFEAVVETHFLNFKLGTYIEKPDPHDNDQNELDDKEERQAYKWGISDVLAHVVEHPSTVNRFIKLESLKEAVLGLATIIQKTKGKLDIGNKGNYMFRRSPYGLMLVINDPISVVD